MKLARVIVAALAVVLGTSGAWAYHDKGCGSGVNFGGGNPATHSWMNACTPAGNVYFFGVFGNIAGGDASGMCGYLVLDTEGPVDAYAGLSGDMQGGIPHPTLVMPANGDWPTNHQPGGPVCKSPLPSPSS